MARGPLPAAQRRRRNKPTIPTTNLPSGGRKGRIPPPPYELDPLGARWWQWAWRTPQAAAWTEGNLYTLGRRALLEDELGAQEQPSSATLREIRELEDRLGLTPRGMAQLRWSIVDDTLGEKAAKAEKADHAAAMDELASARADRRDRIGA